MLKYAILKDRQVVPAFDRAWQEIDERRVAETIDGKIRVSTVFLNINHGDWFNGKPLWFESMAFDENGDELDCDRYETYEQAVAGHQEMCDRLFILDANIIE